MIEAYKIGISLTLNGGIQQTLAGVIKEFASLNTAVKNVQMSVNELASGMRGLQRIGAAAAAEWNSVAAAMGKAANATRAAANGNAAQGQARATGTTGAASPMAISAPTTSALTYAAAGLVVGGSVGGRGVGLPPGGAGGDGIPRLTGPGGTGGIPLGPLRPGVTYPSTQDFAISATAAAGASAAIFSTEKNMFTAGAEIEAMKVRMKMAGYSAEQVAQALDLARTSTGVGGVPGLTQIAALHTMLDIRTMTGSPDAGVAAFPELAKLGLVLGANGHGDQMSELYAAIQAGELRGAIIDHETGKVDTEKFTGFIHNIQAAAIATGFRYGPREILQALRSGGISAAALSDQALFADQVLPTLTLGAAGGGTALQGFGMQFAAGKMSEAAATILNDMGLLLNPKTHKPFRMNLSQAEGGKLGEMKPYKTGIGQFNFPPTVLKNRDSAIQNPADYIIKDLKEGIDRYLIKNHTPVTLNNEQVTAQQLASRIPGGKYIADFLRLAELLARERVQFAAGQKRDAYNIRVSQDPQLQVLAMDAAFHNMMAEFGGALMKDAMKTMAAVTTGLQNLSKWAADHPETATRITEVAAGLGVLGAAIGAISAVLFVAAPMIRVAAWLGTAPGAAISAIPGGAAALGLGARLFKGAGPLGAFILGIDGGSLNAGEDKQLKDLGLGYRNKPNTGQPQSFAPTAANGNSSSVQKVEVVNAAQIGASAASGTIRRMTNGVNAPSGATAFDPRNTPMPTGATP